MTECVPTTVCKRVPVCKEYEVCVKRPRVVCSYEACAAPTCAPACAPSCDGLCLPNPKDYVKGLFQKFVQGRFGCCPPCGCQ